MTRQIVFRGRLDTYTGFGQQLCPTIQFFIKHGFDVKVRATTVCEAFASSVPKEIKDCIVESVPDNLWEWQMLPLVHPLTPGKRVVYSTMWETDQLAGGMIKVLNEAEVVVVPCEWCADVFERCGVTSPIRVVPLGIDKVAYRYRTPPPEDGLCIFGAAGRMGHGIARKGVRKVIEAFQKAFPRDQDVRLHVKVFSDCDIKEVRDPRIIVTRDFMSDEKVGDWLGQLTCFVSAAAAEGWGLWQHQALAVGRPLICCHYGGVTMFTTERNSYGLKYTEESAGEHHAGYGKWALPDMDHLVELLRHVRQNRAEARIKGMFGSIETCDYTQERSALGALEVMEEFGVFDAPAPKRDLVFRHSGDSGDLVWAAPTIRALGGGILYITESSATRERLTPEKADNMARLLRLCPYIKEVRFGYPKGKIDYDLDTFRQVWKVDPKRRLSLYECQAQCWGLDGKAITKDKWLFVDHPVTVPGKPVVVSQTARYINPDFDWFKVAEKYRHQAVFVGLAEEWKQLQKLAQWPELPWHETKNFLEVARVLEGAKLVIANQGGIHAVAEGLHRPMVHAVCQWDPSCWTERDGLINFLEGEMVLPDL